MPMRRFLIRPDSMLSLFFKDKIDTNLESKHDFENDPTKKRKNSSDVNFCSLRRFLNDDDKNEMKKIV